jgi:Tetratricopeptide repeat
MLGTEHPNTLTSMNNLALVLQDQGKYGEAEQIQVMVVVGMLSIFGFEHPNSLTCRNTLLAIWEYRGIEGSASENALLELLENTVSRTT